jgi:hypothetical protein
MDVEDLWPPYRPLLKIVRYPAHPSASATAATWPATGR